MTCRPLGDLAVSGLGWVQLTVDSNSEDGDEPGLAGTAGSSESSLKEARWLEGEGEEGGDEFEDEEGDGAVYLVVHTPKGVEVFTRPAMPVGWPSLEWYEFADLDEDQERARPPLIYEAKSIG